MKLKNHAVIKKSELKGLTIPSYLLPTGCSFLSACLSSPLLVKYTPLGPAQSPQTLQSASVCLENYFWSHEQQLHKQQVRVLENQTSGLSSQSAPCELLGDTPTPSSWLGICLRCTSSNSLPIKRHHPRPCTFYCLPFLPESLPHASPGVS